ncbi:hypothetical protein [Paenibacillus faecalis]|uniref:hypothetical protein n=1 Tax=Paenibacillus faecalis TaxID=2079532 RepID=UPI00131A4E09|nr:hypothetical protein [Paenibacillus faecalis]
MNELTITPKDTAVIDKTSDPNETMNQWQDSYHNATTLNNKLSLKTINYFTEYRLEPMK